ncbi:hypothetical protein ILUMI_01015, partial [Ignelater luminosus]
MKTTVSKLDGEIRKSPFWCEISKEDNMGVKLSPMCVTRPEERKVLNVPAGRSRCELARVMGRRLWRKG